jgi:tol-pal system beta propeller repeat protein TolB
VVPLSLRSFASSRLCAAVSAWGLLLANTASAAEPKRLTHDGRIKFSPSFLNEDEIGFVDFEKPTLTIIKRLNLKDGSVTPLHENVDKQELEPAFSGDGRHSVFLRASGTLQTSLVIRDEQENEDIVIPPGAGFSGYRSPAFSPDGKLVVFSFADEGQQNLFTVNRKDGKDRKQLTKLNRINNWPNFSPDGKQIVFGSTRDGNFELYSMKSDGTDVVRLTENRFQDVRPKFSPDGKHIAFVSTRDGNHEIYIMNSDGSDIRRVTHHDERDDYPVWHPDGRHLVVVAERNGSHDLYLITVPGN